jgi:hypothetical protein
MALALLLLGPRGSSVVEALAVAPLAALAVAPVAALVVALAALAAWAVALAALAVAPLAALAVAPLAALARTALVVTAPEGALGLEERPAAYLALALLILAPRARSRRALRRSVAPGREAAWRLGRRLEAHGDWIREGLKCSRGFAGFARLRGQCLIRVR